MPDDQIQDQLAAAMGVARRARKSRPFDSLRITLATFFGGLAVAGVTIAELVQANMMDKAAGWAVLLGIGLMMGPAVFCALEIRRLVDKSEALNELFDHVKTYESQLADLRSDRDQFRTQT